MALEHSLTIREQAILQQLSNGATLKEIAEGLAYSRDVIDTDMAQIRLELKAKNNSHAVAIALRRAIIT